MGAIYMTTKQMDFAGVSLEEHLIGPITQPEAKESLEGIEKQIKKIKKTSSCSPP